MFLLTTVDSFLIPHTNVIRDTFCSTLNSVNIFIIEKRLDNTVTFKSQYIMK